MPHLKEEYINGTPHVQFISFYSNKTFPKVSGKIWKNFTIMGSHGPSTQFEHPSSLDRWGNQGLSHIIVSHPPYQCVNEAIQFTGTNCNKFKKKFAIRNNTSLNTYTFLLFCNETSH